MMCKYLACIVIVMCVVMMAGCDERFELGGFVNVMPAIEAKPAIQNAHGIIEMLEQAFPHPRLHRRMDRSGVICAGAES